jgi:hypothetical protein
VTAPRPQTRRVNRGRGHSYFLDGDKVPGITTVINKGIPKQLTYWASRETADYAIDHWAELEALPPSERREKLVGAADESRNKASVRGTLIHSYAQRLAAGEEVDVPDEYDGHVQSYLAFAEAWRPEEFVVERPFYSRKFKYAGTPDLVALLADGCTWMLDYKTGDKGIYAEAAIQLAAARFADFVLAEGDTEIPVERYRIEKFGVIWLRADGYDLFPVAADVWAFRYFLNAMRVAEFIDSVKESRGDWIGDMLTPPPNGGGS